MTTETKDKWKPEKKIQQAIDDLIQEEPMFASHICALQVKEDKTGFLPTWLQTGAASGGTASSQRACHSTVSSGCCCMKCYTWPVVTT